MLVLVVWMMFWVDLVRMFGMFLIDVFGVVYVVNGSIVFVGIFIVKVDVVGG